jgi:hypothetical protein
MVTSKVNAHGWQAFYAQTVCKVFDFDHCMQLLFADQQTKLYEFIQVLYYFHGKLWPWLWQ